MSTDTPAMTDAELADAYARHDAYKRSHDHVGAFACCTAHASADDVPRLVAEIERLNTVLDANRVVRNAAESSSRVYKAVVDRLKAERTGLRAEIDRLRVGRPQLTDEFGLRITYVSTLTEERAIADTLGDALEVLAAFDARDRRDVVGKWRKVEEDGRG